MLFLPILNRSDEDPSLYKRDSADLEPPLLFKKRSSLVSKEEERFSFGTINETKYVDISKMSEAPKKQIFAEYFTNITLADAKLICPAIYKEKSATKSEKIIAKFFYKLLYVYRRKKRQILQQNLAYEVRSKYIYNDHETMEINVNSRMAEKSSYHYLMLEKYKKIVPNIVYYFTSGFHNSNIHGANKSVLDNKLFKFPEIANNNYLTLKISNDSIVESVEQLLATEYIISALGLGKHMGGIAYQVSDELLVTKNRGTDLQALSDYIFSPDHFPPLFKCLDKLLKIGIAPTDIKPSNILHNFDSKGIRKSHLVIIDLGLYCFGKTGSEIKILRSNITTYSKLYEALLASDTQEIAISLGRALAVHQLVISMVMMWAKSNGRFNRKNFLYVLESQPFSEEIAFQALKDMCTEVIIKAEVEDVDDVLNFCLDPIKYQDLSLRVCQIFS